MQYWGELQNKYGFNDGEFYPSGIATYRDVYIRVVNILAEKNGSQFRVLPYDRQGAHNTYLCLFYPTKWFEQYYLNRITRDEIWPNTDIADAQSSVDYWDVDEAMDQSIEQAKELGLDSFVEAVVTVSPEFEEFLKCLRAGSH